MLSLVTIYVKPRIYYILRYNNILASHFLLKIEKHRQVYYNFNCYRQLVSSNSKQSCGYP
jgi:hypothetical protein